MNEYGRAQSYQFDYTPSYKLYWVGVVSVTSIFQLMGKR
jgi:hypothetical protein